MVSTRRHYLTDDPEERKQIYLRNYRIINRRKLVAKVREWRHQFPEKAREYRRRWRLRNPDKVNAMARAWRANNPERAKEVQRQYRARRRAKACLTQ